MRYGLHLLPNAFLLIALLRMTLVGMAGQRCAMFFFLCVWLIFSVSALFLGQVWPIESREYAVRFFILLLPTWLCSAPALWIASRRLAFSHLATAAAVLLMAMAACRFAVLNASMSPIAKLLAMNCWAAVVVGTNFLLASAAAEGADLYLWRCCGMFFLIFGFGYLAIGMVRPGEWAMRIFILAGAATWCALAYFIGPRPEHLFNLDKLGVIWPLAKLFGIAIPLGGQRR
ncbi:MAG TPA: hypothetical protein VKQ28_14690 [Candidatus Acidoferrum sp.]|nr:hypothetical protein [Candidatus Acidoferrum sp.]